MYPATEVVTAPPQGTVSAVVGEIARAALLFACSSVLGFAILVLMFRLNILGGMHVLFYRGLVLIIASGIFTLTFAAWGAGKLKLTASTALSAAVLSMSLNLTFLIVLPVTVDRSVSTFLLAYMAEHPDQAYTPAELRNVFDRIYMGDFQQVQRRMDEQTLSGNITHRADGYVISPQGRAFIRSAKAVSWMFETDPRFLAPDTAAKSVSGSKP
jgi:hypothetical protein